jgi:hypothetical protein
VSTDPRTITNTRIEAIAEAVENMAVGIAAKQIARSKSTDGSTPPILDAFVTDAQIELRKALSEFLRPLVRLVDAEPQKQQVDAGDPGVVCANCLGHFPCGSTCEHWALAIRHELFKHQGGAA